MKRAVLILKALPVVQFAISTLLYLLQGGWSAGHGPFDVVIGFAQMPGFLYLFLEEAFMILYTYERDFIPDYVIIVLIPFLINLLLVWGGIKLLNFTRNKRK